MIPRRVAARSGTLLVAAAAALRTGFLVATRHDPVFRIPDLDEAFYHLWARSLATGQGDFQGPYFVGPLYPHCVALLYRLAGPDPFVVRVAQSLLGVADVAFVLGIGRRLFGGAAGLAAAALLALYGPLVFYENVLLLESLLLTLTLGAAWTLLVPAWSATRRGALAGLLLGLASLARPTALFLLPVALIALWRFDASALRAAAPRAAATQRARRIAPGRATAWRAGLACLGVWLVVLLPVLVRNVRLGAFALTTNGGVNFYAGNSSAATGRFHEPPGVQFFRNPMLVAAPPGSTLPPDVARRALTVRAAAGTDEAARSSLWTRRAVDWIVTHPVDFLRLELRKLWLVLQAEEGAQIESWEFQRRRLPPLRLFCIDLGWIWPLALLGLWVAWRARRPGARIVAGFAAGLLLPCVVWFVSSRYRLAAVPELAILAGTGAATLGGWFAARRWRNAGLALAALAVLAVLTRLGTAGTTPNFGWEHVQMADRLYALGDLDGAIASQSEALRAMPERAEVPMQLALYWSERQGPGDLQRAAALLGDTARRAPNDAAVWFNLGVVLVRQGRAEEARDAWQRALVADPGFEPARARLRAATPGTPPRP